MRVNLLPKTNGTTFQIEWQETASQLKHLDRLEDNAHRWIRLQALWHLRCGKGIQDVVEMTGFCYRTIQNWVAWYRQGGLAEVLNLIPGNGSGSTAKLMGFVAVCAKQTEVKIVRFCIPGYA